MIDQVKHIFLVLSGKGGVGKSTVATQVALALVEKNFKVGILDIDLCGPSVPYLLQVENHEIHQSDQGWIPVYTSKEKTLGVISIGFLLDSRDASVIWRGPKKTAMIKQFLHDVNWGDIDYLIIDTPPGTSDEHISVMENLRALSCDGAILVTTPQQVAIEDVRKEVTFCKKTGIRIVGIVENMSGYACPHCDECTNIFSAGGGEALARWAEVPFLAALPIDPRVGQLLNRSCVKELPESASAVGFCKIVDSITEIGRK